MDAQRVARIIDVRIVDQGAAGIHLRQRSDVRRRRRRRHVFGQRVFLRDDHVRTDRPGQHFHFLRGLDRDPINAVGGDAPQLAGAVAVDDRHIAPAQRAAAVLGIVLGIIGDPRFVAVDQHLAGHRRRTAGGLVRIDRLDILWRRVDPLEFPRADRAGVDPRTGGDVVLDRAEFDFNFQRLQFRMQRVGRGRQRAFDFINIIEAPVARTIRRDRVAVSVQRRVVVLQGHRFAGDVILAVVVFVQHIVQIPA